MKSNKAYGIAKYQLRGLQKIKNFLKLMIEWIKIT